MIVQELSYRIDINRSCVLCYDNFKLSEDQSILYIIVEQEPSQLHVH